MMSLLFDVAVFAGGFIAGGYFKGDASSMMSAAREKWNSWFGPKP